MKAWLVVFRGGFQRIELFEADVTETELRSMLKILYGNVPMLEILVVDLSKNEWSLIGRKPSPIQKVH